MPGVRLHLTIARDLANELGSGLVDAERGAYYLGATTPDIRALTRWDRERTHFFSLDDFGEQSGVHRLFEQEPRLRDVATLDAPTAAFMAGYISHLVLDEDYICQIYRPMFGERSSLHGDALADVMDKALQWDVEREDSRDEAKVDEIRTALAEAAVEVNVDFIARESLAQWRDISVDLIATPPTVERLVRFLGRRMPEFRFDDEAGAARFAEEIPALLRRTWEHVGAERVHEYLHGARTRARTAMKEYLA
jgi:hypothetical protein